MAYPQPTRAVAPDSRFYLENWACAPKGHRDSVLFVVFGPGRKTVYRLTRAQVSRTIEGHLEALELETRISKLDRPRLAAPLRFVAGHFALVAAVPVVLSSQHRREFVS